MTININSRFDSNEEKFDNKFDELKIDINEVKNKCVSQCNEFKRDMEKVVESVEKLSLIHI